MATTKKTAPGSQASKKGIIADIVSKMETAFDDLKHELGEKKFGKRLKKAAKILIHGIDANETKPAKQGTKKAVKKSVPKPKKKSSDTKGTKNSELNKETVKKKVSKNDAVKVAKAKVKKSVAPTKNTKAAKPKLTK